jgi:hypothetical protein
LLEEIMKHSVVEHCPEIEEFFDKNIRSYELLEELPGLAKSHEQSIVMPCIPYNDMEFRAKKELKVAYDKLNKSWKDPIPFIEFSFPKDYKCKHGEDYRHVYIFFFTNYTKLDGAQECTLYYLNKLNSLKAFL